MRENWEVERVRKRVHMLETIVNYLDVLTFIIPTFVTLP